MKKSDPIAIVGMSCLFPGSSNLDAFWQSMHDGAVHIREIPADRWNHAAFYSPDRRNAESTYARKIAYLDDIRSFGPEQYGMPPRRAYPMDPQQRLFLDQSRVALDDAGYRGRPLPKATGVYVGASGAEYRDLVASRQRARQLLGGELGRVPSLPSDTLSGIVRNVSPAQKYTMVGLLSNMIACNVSGAFDLRGPALVTDAACSSALLAIHSAVLHLRTGICDAAIVGGVYTICTPDLLIGFSRIGALSGSDVCRPFDQSADGFVVGEGTGVVVLKRLDDAVRDNDHIWAVIRGVGLNNDGRGEGPMTPRLSGQVDALGRAYKDADVSPETVGYIEAHGTATSVGDLTEMAALKENLNSHGQGKANCAVASVKGNIGHTLAASGIAGFIRAVLAIDRGTIPPQAGLQTVRAELNLEGSGFHIPLAPEPFKAQGRLPRRAGVSAFGFGGTNVHVVLEEMRKPRQRKAISATAKLEPPQLFVISAATPVHLTKHLNDLLSAIEARPTPLSDLAYSLTVARRRENACVAFVAHSRTHLLEMLKKSISVVDGELQDGVFYSSEPLAEDKRKTAFLFPGQGKLWSEDGGHFCRRFPAFQARLEEIVSTMGGVEKFPSFAYLHHSGNGSGNGSSGEKGAHHGEDPQGLAATQTALVQFFAGLELRQETDPKIFIQLGRNGASAGHANQTSSSQSAESPRVIHMFESETDAGTSFLNGIAELAVLGVPLNLTSLFDRPQMASLPSPPYPSRPYWIVSKGRRHENGAELTLGGPVVDLPFEAFSDEEDEDAVFNESIATCVAGLAEDPIQQKVLEVILQLTAFPAESLKPELRFAADLGFDSLMWMDLYDGLIAAIPEAKDLPESLIRMDTTVGDLMREVSAAVLRSELGVQTGSNKGEIQRYAVVSVDRPLPSVPPGPLALGGPIAIVADTRGVASLLAQRLEQAGCEVKTVLSAEPFSRDGAAGLIDLTGLNPAEQNLQDPVALRAPVMDAMRRAREMAAGGPGPTTFVTASTGIRNAGIAGMIKALAHEWPEALVRSVEMDTNAAPEWIAEQIFAELAFKDQPAEISYASGSRTVLALEKQAIENRTLPDGVVVAISGGGRGLGAKLAIELARRHKTRLLLLGRSPEASETVQSVIDAGGQALYVSCDVRNAFEVANAFQQFRDTVGPIQYVVHTSGILADASIDAKDLDLSEAVIDTKIAGGLALWEAAKADPLSTFLLYSSWSGRFGNASQTDYSAANHLLGKLASSLNADRPSVRVITMDLPPWEGSGMVNSMPEAVRNALAGRIRFLSDETGLGLVLAELGAQGASGEIVVGAGLEEKLAADRSQISISRTEQPWLDDHSLDGRVLVPLAASLDYAAAAAVRVGVGPGMALSNIQVAEPFMVPQTGATRLEVTALRNRDAVEIGVSAVGHAKQQPAVGLRISTISAPVELLALPPGGKAPDKTIREFYQGLDFHGPRFQVLTSVLDIGASHIAGQIRVPGGTDGPGGAVLDILALDGMLQLIAYWGWASFGVTGLPFGADEIRLLARPQAGIDLGAVALLKTSSEGVLTADLDLLDSEKRPLIQIRGLRCKLIQRRAQTPEAATAAVVDETRVDASSWHIGEFPEVLALHDLVRRARSVGIESPYFSVHERVTNETSMIGGREFVNFASYNYLGLSGDPEITAGAVEAMNRYGTSVSASRLVSGEKPLHGELEREIAEFLGCQDAIVFVSGHATNVSVIGDLFGPQDLVIHDSLAHDSILTGARLSGAKRHAFAHNDPEALDQLLRQTRHTARRVLIAVEAVYSMDGDIAPLAKIIEIKKRHNALLLVDEAHSLGVLGQTGRGIGEHFAVNRADVEFWMGTLSKSLASCGGYIAGSSELVNYLKHSNPGFVYSVGMSPANAGAALAALRKLKRSPNLVATLQERSRLFLNLCRKRGINTGMSEGTPVIPCIVGSSVESVHLSRAMAARGINVQPILHPAVEEHMARLRFFLTARHSEQQIRLATDALAEELERIDPRHLAIRPAVETQQKSATHLGA